MPATQWTFFCCLHLDMNFGKTDNDWFEDSMVTNNLFENDVNGWITSGGAADGYYGTTGIGASLKGGKYFRSGTTTITPYTYLTAFTNNSSHYTLSNGMDARVGVERSMVAEAGVNTAHTFTLRNGTQLQPYVQLAVTEEFDNDNHVDVNDDGHFVNDLS
jgi:outer membrane autotransporter protein